MEEFQDGSKLKRFFSVSSLAKKMSLLILLIAFILAFLLGSELFARPSKKVLETNAFSSPFHSGSCASCHRVNGTDVSSSLRLEVPELCLECHTKTAAAMKDAFRHEIFDHGECLVCHSVHSPAASHLLRADVSSLCGQCHAEAARLVTSGPHGQDPGACLKCHLNHSSGAPALLRDKAVSLCLGCHDLGPRGRYHPVGEGLIDPLTSGELTCTSSCHHPHGSENERMLRQQNSDGLCLSCHDMTVI
jgi:predicted CXXCH cytochrome family protein